MPLPPNDTETIDTVISMLARGKMPREGRFFENALKWVENFPGHIDNTRKAKLLTSIQWCFDIREEELYALISGLKLPKPIQKALAIGEADFDAQIPSEGWLRSYIEFTRFCEAPMPYHAFASLVVLGAAVGRKVRLESGHYNTYPNLCVLLIGPPGRLKKSTCVGIARKLVTKATLCPIFPDKCTPEAFTTLLREKPHQFIGAPELSMFLGKQKYNEGLVTLLLRLLDTEDMPVDVSTLGRGTELIENHTLCMIGGSTMSLFTQATADQVASSGFISRFVSVVEEDTPRCFPTPRKSDSRWENDLLLTLDYMKQKKAVMTLSESAQTWYDYWYRERWKFVRNLHDDTLIQTQERGPEHLKRIAMLLHLADHHDIYICVDCLKQAAWLLSYAEKTMPRMVAAINRSVKSGETDHIMDQIRRAGGAVDHSKLLRSLSSKGVDAPTLKAAVLTLKESGRLREEKRGNLRFYIIEEEVA